MIRAILTSGSMRSSAEGDLVPVRGQPSLPEACGAAQNTDRDDEPARSAHSTSTLVAGGLERLHGSEEVDLIEQEQLPLFLGSVGLHQRVDERADDHAGEARI